jgi:hypothetical protein
MTDRLFLPKPFGFCIRSLSIAFVFLVRSYIFAQLQSRIADPFNFLALVPA